MSDFIRITQDDNCYILRDETPEYNELSIYVNEDNTRVSQSKCMNPGGGKYRHVKVVWMYEKEKIAFISKFIYSNIEMNNQDVLLEVKMVDTKIRNNASAEMNYMKDWTKDVIDYLRIKTDKEE